MFNSLQADRENRSRFLLPRWLRWACILSALFIAYSEFVSVALSSLKRGIDDGPQISPGVEPPLYGVVSLLSPWRMIRMAEDASIHGDVVAGILVAFAGCAGLLLAACARPRRSLSNAQVYALGAAGMTVPIVIKLYEFKFGSLGRRRGSEGVWPIVHEPVSYPVYGYAELVGGFFYPFLAYFAMMMIFPVIWSSDGEDKSHAPLRAQHGLFPEWVRWGFLLLALFVAYSQFVSAALTGYFRYDPLELSFIDGGEPEIFSVVSFLEPLQRVATLAVQESSYWVFSPFRDLLVAVVLNALGTGGLVAAGVMRACSRYPKLVLAIGSLFGIVAAGAIKYYELAAGSLGLADRLTRSTSGAPINPIHPIYGYVELWGSLFVPIAVYSVMLLGILVGAGQDLIGWSRRRGVARRT